MNEQNIQTERISRLQREVAFRDLVIDHLYYALGPAADDIMESAYEYAERNVDDE